LQLKAQPKIDAARYKAEAGLSKRGYVHHSHHSAWAEEGEEGLMMRREGGGGAEGVSAAAGGKEDEGGVDQVTDTDDEPSEEEEKERDRQRRIKAGWDKGLGQLEVACWGRVEAAVDVFFLVCLFVFFFSFPPRALVIYDLVTEVFF